jgi:hypothetical protein
MIDIEKIKLNSDRTAKIRYTVDTETLVNAEYNKRFAHDDFVNAMQALTPHLYELCELGVAAYDDELDKVILKGYQCTQIVFGGEGEYYGCTLVGKKELAGNRVLNLVAPFISFLDDERHSKIHILEKKAMAVLNEGILYVEGKAMPDPQLEMDFEATVEIQEAN